MATVLITGANRGLGLEFCKQYADDGWQVLACCRKPEAATELQNHPQINLYALDVTNFDQIDRLAEQLNASAVDVLINNAGIYGDKSHRCFGRLDYDSWTKTLKINTQAPVKMAESFLPHIQRGNKKLIVSITSQMGSIEDNGSGGSILYRSSKAALNAAMKSLALDLKKLGIGILIVHPGWVKTDMGGQNAMIDATTSVAGIRLVIARFNPNQSGRFTKYDGSYLPW
jgi:NAD(P)-dependent dehydrogenase (short-subunit alcohol dehydrogenase family)